MSDEAKDQGKKIGRYLSTLSPERLQEMSQQQSEAATAEHAEFKKAYDAGNCYLCGGALTSLDETKPCAHWLLNPKGFKKKQHFSKVTKKYGYHLLQSVLRGLANEDGFAKNINDISSVLQRMPTKA